MDYLVLSAMVALFIYIKKTKKNKKKLNFL